MELFCGLPIILVTVILVLVKKYLGFSGVGLFLYSVIHFIVLRFNTGEKVILFSRRNGVLQPQY